MDCSPPGSSIHGILQARIAMPSSRGSTQPRDQTRISNVSCIGRWVLPLAPPGKPNIITLINFIKDFSAVVTELIANNISLEEINPYLQT